MKSWAIIVSSLVGCAASVSCSRHAAQESAAPSNKGPWIERVSALEPGASRGDLLRALPERAKHIPGFMSLGEGSEFFIVSNRWEVAVVVQDGSWEQSKLVRPPVD
jgi:hypothetical protein